MKKTIFAAAVLAAVAAATPAAAQNATSANPRALAGARLVKPLTFKATRDLNFGTIVMGTMASAQTVEMDLSGAITTCGTSGGGLTCVGTPTSAAFNVTGTQGQQLKITAAATYQLTGPGGAALTFTPTLPVGNVVTLPNSGTNGVDFNMGGKVVIATNQAEGIYSGEVNITVEY